MCENNSNISDMTIISIVQFRKSKIQYSAKEYEKLLEAIPFSCPSVYVYGNDNSLIINCNADGGYSAYVYEGQPSEKHIKSTSLEEVEQFIWDEFYSLEVLLKNPTMPITTLLLSVGSAIDQNGNIYSLDTNDQIDPDDYRHVTACVIDWYEALSQKDKLIVNKHVPDGFVFDIR